MGMLILFSSGSKSDQNPITILLYHEHDFLILLAKMIMQYPYFRCANTIIREIFIVKIFLWLAQLAKIYHMKFLTTNNTLYNMVT